MTEVEIRVTGTPSIGAVEFDPTETPIGAALAVEMAELRDDRLDG